MVASADEERVRQLWDRLGGGLPPVEKFPGTRRHLTGSSGAVQNILSARCWRTNRSLDQRAGSQSTSATSKCETWRAGAEPSATA